MAKKFTAGAMLDDDLTIHDWTGRVCPKCGGTGEQDDVIRRCQACAGTGEEYGFVTNAPRTTSPEPPEGRR